MYGNKYEGIDDNSSWNFETTVISDECGCYDIDNCKLPFVIQSHEYQPTLDNENHSYSINLFSDKYIPTISGSISNFSENGTVLLSISDKTIANTTVDELGRWSISNISLEGFSSGNFSLYIDAIDSLGNVIKSKLIGSIFLYNSPKILSHTPINNSIVLDPRVNINIIFDKNISKSSGNIDIYNLDGSLYYSIDVTNIEVYCNDTSSTYCTSIYIDSNIDFKYGSEYFINIDSTSFIDESGNYYNGIDDNSTWKFEIGSGPCGDFNLDNCVLNI